MRKARVRTIWDFLFVVCCMYHVMYCSVIHTHDVCGYALIQVYSQLQLIFVESKLDIVMIKIDFVLYYNNTIFTKINGPFSHRAMYDKTKS